MITQYNSFALKTCSKARLSQGVNRGFIVRTDLQSAHSTGSSKTSA